MGFDQLCQYLPLGALIPHGFIALCRVSLVAGGGGGRTAKGLQPARWHERTQHWGSTPLDQLDVQQVKEEVCPRRWGSLGPLDSGVVPLKLSSSCLGSFALHWPMGYHPNADTRHKVPRVRRWQLPCLAPPRHQMLEFHRKAVQLHRAIPDDVATHL